MTRVSRRCRPGLVQRTPPRRHRRGIVGASQGLSTCIPSRDRRNLLSRGTLAHDAARLLRRRRLRLRLGKKIQAKPVLIEHTRRPPARKSKLRSRRESRGSPGFGAVRPPANAGRRGRDSAKPTNDDKGPCYVVRGPCTSLSPRWLCAAVRRKKRGRSEHKRQAGRRTKRTNKYNKNRLLGG